MSRHRAKRVCTWLVGVFAILYLAALLLLAVGTFGWFGQAPDPLAGAFLIPLGLPWIWITTDAPEPFLPWLGALAPLVNLALLMLFCRWRSGRARQ